MLRVRNEAFISEKFVSHIWDGGHFTKEALRAKDGRRIEVIYQGQWNDEEGADFNNAEIKINGQIFRGDVEIHVRGSHWRMHNHDLDPIYNSTILHVVMWDDSIKLLTKKQNGELIPTLVLYDFLDSSIGKLLKTIEKGSKRQNPCYTSYTKSEKKAEPEHIGRILDSAGMSRFLFKAKMFEESAKDASKGASIDQLLYERMMEALGYSKNKAQFLELAQRAPLESLKGRTAEEVQAILFGVAGLLPSPGSHQEGSETEDYINELNKIWSLFSSQFKDRQMNYEQWEFFRIRPDNHPIRRIAGISYILSKCKDSGEDTIKLPLLTMFLPAFSEVSQTSQRLQEILISRASGYWMRYYTFGGKRHKEGPFLMGQSRADDIVVNVILPAVFAYARQLRDDRLQQAVTMAYSSYRILQDNQITRYVADGIFPDNDGYNSVVNSAMRQQGLIHIYKSFCDTRNCQNCPLKGLN